MRFHEGELAVQDSAGVLDDARRTGRFIRDAISPGARGFLAERPFAVIAGAAPDGRLWTSILSGGLPFLVSSDDGQQLRVGGRPRVDDPLSPGLRAGASIGLVAIDFEARRRFRVNGRLLASDSGLVIDVREAYSNCPKYIHAYAPRPEGPALDRTARNADQLDAAQSRWIERADTFFLGTLHPEAGADASHRGGPPGFVRVGGPRSLTWRDYRGNNFFNSLGNAVVNPAAALLFLDFETGSTLQLSGRLRIDWPAEREGGARTERVLEFEVDQVVETDGAVALRWSRG